MKKIFVLFLLVTTVFCGCGKDTFYDKFVPEIIYYQNADVENVDFTEATIAPAVTAWTVKARVSAPMKLKQIQLFKLVNNQNEELVQTYDDFQLTPNVYKLNYTLNGISTNTTIRIVAIDQDNKTSSKNFIIKK